MLARSSFKLFLRETYWENRRIIPAYQNLSVKLGFKVDPPVEDAPEFEFMWVGDVQFDGHTVFGELQNSPNWVTGLASGDAVSAPFEQLADWMMIFNDKAYGAFTVQVIRSDMKTKDRSMHDHAWGIDFPDPASVRLLPGIMLKPPGNEPPPASPQKKKRFLSGLFGKSEPQTPPPDNDLYGSLTDLPDLTSLPDTPMALNMVEKAREHLEANPDDINAVSALGLTPIQDDAMAGNIAIVKLLMDLGADPFAENEHGDSALSLARRFEWQGVIDIIQAGGKLH